MWDLYMDWGILRSKNIKVYGLREKITFSKYFYYWAAFSNLMLRFFWIVFIWRNFEIWDNIDHIELAKEFQF